MRTLWLREGKQAAQNHTAPKWQRQGLNPGWSILEGGESQQQTERQERSAAPLGLGDLQPEPSRLPSSTTGGTQLSVTRLAGRNSHLTGVCRICTVMTGDPVKDGQFTRLTLMAT